MDGSLHLGSSFKSLRVLRHWLAGYIFEQQFYGFCSLLSKEERLVVQPLDVTSRTNSRVTLKKNK